MADFGIQQSGDDAGVAGVGTGGNAQQNNINEFFPIGVLGVGGPEAGLGVCGLGYSPVPIPAVLIAPNDAVGVYGQGGAGNSIGVVGVGTGSAPGVSGIADPNSVTANGTGVSGRGGVPTGVGVCGTGGSEHGTANPPSGNAIGVFGAAGSGDADGVYGIGSGSKSGVVGLADPNSETGIGVRGGGRAVGVTGAVLTRQPHRPQVTRSACSERPERARLDRVTASMASAPERPAPVSSAKATPSTRRGVPVFPALAATAGAMG
jgi:hypothetical protein